MLGLLLPRFNPAARAELARRLDALPPPEPASATIGPESRYVLAAVRARLDSIGPPSGPGDLDALGLDAAATAVLRDLTDGDRGRLFAHLGGSGPAFDELARRLDLPQSTVGSSLDDFEHDERGRWPIVVGVVDAARGCRQVVDRMHALRAMLRAGMALVDGGEPAFRQVPDPFGNGPLELERRGEIALIRSVLPTNMRSPLALQVGEDAPAG